jgi:hypothetical protein
MDHIGFRPGRAFRRAVGLAVTRNCGFGQALIQRSSLVRSQWRYVGLPHLFWHSGAPAALAFDARDVRAACIPRRESRQLRRQKQQQQLLRSRDITGNYTIAVSGASGSITQTTTVTLTVN